MKKINIIFYLVDTRLTRHLSFCFVFLNSETNDKRSKIIIKKMYLTRTCIKNKLHTRVSIQTCVLSKYSICVCTYIFV